MSGFFDTIGDIKDVVANTPVDGTGWKIQAAIWASKIFYVKHKDYLIRMSNLTRSSREGVRKTVEQVVSYIGSLKLEDFVMSAIATMTDVEKTLIVYLSFAQLKKHHPDAERLFPDVQLGQGNNYSLVWSEDLPQTEVTTGEATSATPAKEAGDESKSN